MWSEKKVTAPPNRLPDINMSKLIRFTAASVCSASAGLFGALMCLQKLSKLDDVLARMLQPINHPFNRYVHRITMGLMTIGVGSVVAIGTTCLYKHLIGKQITPYELICQSLDMP